MAHFIFIYGPIAVGKLTVAELLAKELGYTLTHNHVVNDLVTDIFDHKSPQYDRVVEKMRFVFLEEVAKAGADVITTHCYAHNFVNKTTGLSDPDYVVEIVGRMRNVGAKVSVIHLKADTNILISRVSGESRKRFRKLTDPDEMKRMSITKDWQTSAPIEDQLVIDTTNMTSVEVAQMIKKHFKL